LFAVNPCSSVFNRRVSAELQTRTGHFTRQKILPADQTRLNFNIQTVGNPPVGRLRG
jgi:hypothetical protein